MNRKPILCVGALTFDLVLGVEALPSSAGKHMANRASAVAAGMAASAATAIARLDYPVALWASAGRDVLGDYIVAEITAEGIDIGHINRVDGPSAIAAILVDGEGERVVVPYYDPAIVAAPSSTPPFADGNFAAVLCDVRWPHAAAFALDAARRAGAPAILDLDTGPKDVLGDLAKRATHVVASLAGARSLTGESDPVGCLAAMAKGAPETFLAVTDGENGVWYEEGGVVRHLPAFAVAAVDTNAAGDVFHGAFAVACAEGFAMPAALEFAGAAAAIKCTRFGGRTGAPGRSEVLQFLGQNPFKPHAIITNL